MSTSESMVDVKEEPMPLSEARHVMALSLGAFVRARYRWERDVQRQSYELMRAAFRKTYGEEEWRRSFDQALDEGLLEYFVYDREALRDG